MLVVAQLAPAPAAAMPEWLALAICHAPSDNAPDQPAQTRHDHCALCQLAQVAGLPPVPAFVPRPASAYAATTRWVFLLRMLPSLPRAYASRAPPWIG